MNRLIEETCDVLVAGGGSAGVPAAIQAARAGARTVLVEMHPQLGGTTSTGGVGAPAYFYSNGRPIIAGYGWQVTLAALALHGEPLPDLANPPPQRPGRGVRLNPYAFALVAEEAVLDAGVTLHYQEIPTAVRAHGEGWLVELAGKGQLRRLRCREIVDCTGDAELAALAGLPRTRAATRQPGTLVFWLEGYDAAALDHAAIEARYRAARASGALRPGDFHDEEAPFINFLRAAGGNCQHVFGADSSTADDQTRANLHARASLLRLVRFIRTLPGCEHARIGGMMTHCAVRDGHRIAGETTITYDDYMRGRLFADAVAYSFYFIDVHHERGIHREFLAPGVVPTIPFSALIPRGGQRILAAGRSVSSDDRAHSALRVQASCMAMGQAAGAAAALACRLGVPSRDVPLGQLRQLLRDHGAIVPPDSAAG